MDFNRIRQFEPSRSFSNGLFSHERFRAGYFDLGLVGRDICERTLGSREAVRWELEKQRIRAELIEEDIARRRQIEEEVRRELAIEREIALRQESWLIDSALPVRQERRLLDSSITEIKSFGRPSLEFESAISRFRPESGDSGERGIPALWETGKSSVPVHTSASNLKRKVPLPPTTTAAPAEASVKELPWLAAPRKKKKTTQDVWTCGLCNISCTSRDSLSSHRLGKKHRAKVAESEKKVEEATLDKIDAETPETIINQVDSGPSCNAGCAGKSVDTEKQPGSKKSVLPNASSRGSNKRKRKRKATVKYSFWCEHCGVECNSVTVRDKHLSGKKHAAKVAPIEKSGCNGLRIQSVEIEEVKHADQSVGESTALVPKEGGNGNEGGEVAGC